jgi:hypothetical protein
MGSISDKGSALGVRRWALGVTDDSWLTNRPRHIAATAETPCN